MNIKQAKEEIKHTVQAYLSKDAFGEYKIPAVRQRPVLLIGPPGIGKTQIMEQIARECEIGLVAYTITHHTRQSAVGLPFIEEEQYRRKNVFCDGVHHERDYCECLPQRLRRAAGKRESFLLTRSTAFLRRWRRPCCNFCSVKRLATRQVPEGWIIAAAGNPPEYNKSVRDFDMVTLRPCATA